MCAVVENVQLPAAICAVVKTGSAFKKCTLTVVSQKTVNVNQAFHRISDLCQNLLFSGYCLDCGAFSLKSGIL